jgi:hypothetical protein
MVPPDHLPTHPVNSMNDDCSWFVQITPIATGPQDVHNCRSNHHFGKSTSDISFTIALSARPLAIVLTINSRSASSLMSCPHITSPSILRSNLSFADSACLDGTVFTDLNGLSGAQTTSTECPPAYTARQEQSMYAMQVWCRWIGVWSKPRRRRYDR